MNTTNRTTAQSAELPIPDFFKAKNAADWGYYPNAPNLMVRAVEWARTNGILPVGRDRKVITVLGIDNQNDFCNPQGTLFVGGRSGRGAVDDSVRFVEFLYRNMGLISEIDATLDTHRPFQIFSTETWEDKDGNPVSAFSFKQITTADVEKGEFRPRAVVANIWFKGNYTYLLEYVKHYCRELEKQGKYTLTLWPPHCLLGTPGHNLVGVVAEAMLFHQYVRGSASRLEVKGYNFFTENYSVFKPEVMTRPDPRGGSSLLALEGAQRNVAFIRKLMESDAVIIGGQAASHCVKSSIEDFLDEILAKDPALAKKVYVLRDCMSAVTVPDGKGGFYVDNTPDAEAALRKFENAGMNVVDSTTPIASWPGITL